MFSAVASAFILDVQAQIQPNYTQLTYDVLVAMANSNGLNLPPKPDSDSPWTGPSPILVHVQSILYSSLAVSLLAAFVAMLGKQWLSRYSADIHGSLIDRSRDRQRKMNGMSTWRFDVVMEILPMMLQAALLLLGYALYAYLSTIDSLVSWVIAAFTASGVLFYVLIVFAAILSYDCPFQTPFPIFFHFLVRLDRKHRKYLRRSQGWVGRTFMGGKKQQVPGGQPLPLEGELDGGKAGGHIELAMFGQHENSPLVFEHGTDWEGYVLDSNCISWMSEKIMDEDSVLDIMKFIPEVVWHPGIRSAPLEKLYNFVVECFDYSSGRPVVISKLKKKAYLCAKALLHVAVQRKCLGRESDKAVFDSISRRHQNMGSKYHRGDSDLESTLCIIDRVFKTDGFEEIPWKDFSFSHAHHTWMGRILLYRACYLLENGEPLSSDIKEFVLYSLQRDPPPPAPIVLHCLLIIGLLLGARLDGDDQHVMNKKLVMLRPLSSGVKLMSHRSQRFRSQIDRIYKQLATTFRDIDSTTDQIDRALEALRLIAPLSENEIATKSYHLFHVVMQAPVSEAYSEEKKWEASRFALHGAYKWDKVLPWVDDPQDILTFLNYHFELAAKGENQDVPIQNALRALAYASSSVTTEALKNFDPTQPSFVLGTCHVFKREKPVRLRKAALFLLPLIGDKWFNTRDPIMKPDEMKELCEDWASAVDNVGPATVQRAALTVLFGMMNSRHWRPHIVKDKWKLLEYFVSVPHDSEPLRRCLENTELISAISEVGSRDAAVLWPTILWVKYKELSPEVRKQLEQATKAAPRSDVDMYLGAIDSQWTDAEDALTKYTTWSTDPEALVLRAKIDNLREARAFLVAVKQR